MEIKDHAAGDEAVDSEEIPLAAFEPGAEPAQSGEAGEKAEDHSETSGEEAAVQVDDGSAASSTGFDGMEETESFFGDGRWREDDGESEGKFFCAVAC